jgi:hypothetical protein
MNAISFELAAQGAQTARLPVAAVSQDNRQQAGGNSRRSRVWIFQSSSFAAEGAVLLLLAATALIGIGSCFSVLKSSPEIPAATIQDSPR